METAVVSRNADRSILKPAREYKQEAIKVTASIVLFAVVYLSLILMAILLAAFVSYLGIQLIILKPMFLTVMIGLGLIGLGAMVIFFLIKFIFTSKKIDRTGFREIKKDEFPELFNYIQTLAKETRTPFPKRIYLTPEVNASVFYDSSFLSMFFPVKKNLLIGLGLVNSVNLSEFKAVLAHEFGHFSQDSMRLGSYVFNTNKIIYNMLYDNEGYSNTLQSWANASGYFAVFAIVTTKIVQFIQYVLRQVYVVVNKTNMSLSRQMEHHADTVSAFVAGANHITSSLNRLEIGETCYQMLINNYDKWIAENVKPVNMFEHHKEVLSQYAKDNDYESENGLPVINENSNSRFLQSRVVFKNQWASHPSTPERGDYLKKLGMPNHQTVTQSPWSLFGDPQKIQKELTENLFSHIKYKGDIEPMDVNAFREKYLKEHKQYTYDKKYRGFYDNRKIDRFTLDNHVESTAYKEFDQLFCEENIQLPRRLSSVSSDIQLLKNLEEANIKTFDFDGVKRKKKDIPSIVNELEKEEIELKTQLNGLEYSIFRFFCEKTDENGKKRLADDYMRYFDIAAETEKALKDYNELVVTINPIYSGRIGFDIARKIINDVRNLEKGIKFQFKTLLPELIRDNILNEELAKKAENYLNKERDYLDSSGFNDIELGIFNEAMGIYINAVYEREFRAKKQILDKQLELLN